MTVVLMAEFDRQETLLAACEVMRRRKWPIHDAYTPYPVEGLGKALGGKGFGIRTMMLCGGLGAAALAWFVQWYSATAAFPFDSGSRPHNSWPVFPLVTFEFGVLMAAIFGFAGLLWTTGLPRLNHPFFDSPAGVRASQDRFVLAVEIPTRPRSRAMMEAALVEAGALGISEATL